ncbi:MAG: selenide, water dikinase SelD, partial [Nitrospinota bacterium]
GGAEKMMEAGGVIVGGHSVDDPEPKYGIAVTGIVDPRKMITNTGAKPGDALILTKKIGTGIITSTRKSRTGFGKVLGRLTGGDGGRGIRDDVFEEAIEGMKTLNRTPGELMAEAGAGACTDITGFGLLGHAHNLAAASGVTLEISYGAVPKYDGIEAFAIPGTKGGGERNRRWIREKVHLESGVGENEYAVLCDAQTSGPLLVAVDAAKAEPLVERMKSAGVLAPAVIGRVVEGPAGEIRVVS